MAMDHDLMQASVAAYAMNALEAGEREEVRRHLLTCEPCRIDLESFEQTISWLGLLTDPVQLPASFTEGVLARRVDPNRNAPREAAPRNRLRMALLAAAMVGLVAVTTVAVVSLRDSRAELSRQRVLVEALVGDDQIELAGPGPASARIVPTDGGAIFLATGLPALGENVVYQLWIKDGDVITSGGTFETSEGSALVRIERTFGDFTGALVTIEPPGGSRQPTTAPVVDSI